MSLVYVLKAFSINICEPTGKTFFVYKELTGKTFFVYIYFLEECLQLG